VGGLAQICRGLVEHGMPGSMPAAVVEKATLPEQRVVEGTLLSLAETAKAQRVAPPALLIVGEVVRLRARLAWFGQATAAAVTPGHPA
jgi:siroheme synthase